jgi:ribose transport system permease protein
LSRTWSERETGILEKPTGKGKGVSGNDANTKGLLGPNGPGGFNRFFKSRSLKGQYGRIFRSVLPFAAIVGLFIIFTAANPRFASVANLFNITRQSSVLIVVALAGTFIVLQGSIDLSVGSMVTFAGILSSILILKVGAPAIILIPIVGLVAGLFNGVLFAYGKLPSFLVTLGTLFVFDGAALYISRGHPQPFDAPGMQSVVNGSLIGGFPNLGLLALVVYGLCVFVAFRTKFGRYMFSIGGGERVAKLSGVPVNFYKFLSFGVSGSLAALGGLMLASRISAGAPSMGEPFLLDSIAAVVIGGTALSGGVGGPHRTILGALVISILTNGMNILNVYPFTQIIIRGLVVIAAVALTMDRSKIELMK